LPNKSIFSNEYSLIFILVSENYFPNVQIPSEVHENLARIHSHINSVEFRNFRNSVESTLEIERYQYYFHPQMNSKSSGFSDHIHSYRPLYQNSNNRNEPKNRNGANIQHRPKPNYPHASPKSNENGRFNKKKNAVPDEEILKRMKKDGKKRILYAGENLQDKKKEIEDKYKIVFFGNEQPTVSYWMQVIQRIFNNSEKKENNFVLFLEMKQELFNLGIEISGVDEAMLQNSTCRFDILEYEKEIDSEYVPGLKMFVPYMTINF